MTTAEILTPIDDGCLPQLSEMYKNKPDWAPYVYSFVDTAIKWKNKGRNQLTTFWSPNNSWKEDGTFIALMQLVVARFKALSVSVILVINIDIFFLLYFRCPLNVYIKKLDKSVASVIDSLYKPHRYRYSDGDKFISTLIEMNQGYGLFLKENGVLVAWVMRTCLGQIGFLQTVDGYYKKGYATFLAQYVSKQIAKEGFIPMGAISQSNLSSLSLFRKLGFREAEACYFLEVNK
ncbi:hypothetical protein NQ314_016145 [Rhamnusium bicolor]|uniref:N-acetyltransferase domain-containing protein n=1 Tax=Rhamnusium bicolor TaxID=1586634 RepID=A0AAV8WXS7_9CUCU|nr:hypothetical protein NQ314_016145 [Rhamnusium bicolor]